MGKSFDQFRHLDEADYALEIAPLGPTELTALHGRIKRKLIAASMGTAHGAVCVPMTAGMSLLPAAIGTRRLNVNLRRLKIIETRIEQLNAEYYHTRKRDFALPAAVLGLSFGLAHGAEDLFVEHLANEHAVHAAKIAAEIGQEHLYTKMHGQEALVEAAVPYLAANAAVQAVPLRDGKGKSRGYNGQAQAQWQAPPMPAKYVPSCSHAPPPVPAWKASEEQREAHSIPLKYRTVASAPPPAPAWNAALVNEADLPLTASRDCYATPSHAPPALSLNISSYGNDKQQGGLPARPRSAVIFTQSADSSVPDSLHSTPLPPERPASAAGPVQIKERPMLPPRHTLISPTLPPRPGTASVESERSSGAQSPVQMISMVDNTAPVSATGRDASPHVTTVRSPPPAYGAGVGNAPSAADVAGDARHASYQDQGYGYRVPVYNPAEYVS